MKMICGDDSVSEILSVLQSEKSLLYYLLSPMIAGLVIISLF